MRSLREGFLTFAIGPPVAAAGHKSSFYAVSEYESSLSARDITLLTNLGGDECVSARMEPSPRVMSITCRRTLSQLGWAGKAYACSGIFEFSI